jgi:hypothetical protein
MAEAFRLVIQVQNSTGAHGERGCGCLLGVEWGGFGEFAGVPDGGRKVLSIRCQAQERYR